MTRRPPCGVDSTVSRRMASVGQRDTMPELVLRRELHRRGLRYRLHAAHLPGTPDIVFPREKIVIFVNGCFWHRHKGCPRASMPKSNQEYWQRKFRDNVARDERNRLELADIGWTPIIVWECEIRTSFEKTVNMVHKAVTDARNTR